MTLWRFWLSCVLAIATLLTLFPAPARAESASESAHRHYVLGLESARRGDLQAAKGEFERAFAESPHYAVRFNLGKVCFELGELAEARGHFTAYLEEGKGKISETREREVTQALHEIEQRMAEKARPAVPVASERASTAPPAKPAPPAAVTSASPKQRTPEQRPTPSELDRTRRRTLAYAVGATGAVVLATGIGTLIWNQGRQSDAESVQETLRASPPPAEIRSDEELAAVIDYERALAQNQADLDAAADGRAVAWTLVGVGSALVASSVVLFVTSRPESGVHVRAGFGRFAVSGVW